MKFFSLFLLTSFCFPAFQAVLPYVVYKNGEAKSGLPLGGLGTGYIEMLSSGGFGKSTIQNNFLNPVSIPSDCYLFIDVGGEHIPLRNEDVEEVRLFGHFPIADLSYRDPKLPFPIKVKAFSPFLKGDTFNSSIPCVLFRFSFGRSRQQAKVRIGMSWTAKEEKQGNLAGAIGWDKKILAPGEEIVGRCAVWLDKDKGYVNLPSSFEVPVEKKGSEIKDEKTAVAVSDWGAFNWEEKGQFTMPYKGKGHLSAIFYSVHWKGGSCGVYYARAGFIKENLKVVEELRISNDSKCAKRRLRSEDGLIELIITDLLENGILWREMRLKNISTSQLNDVSLSLFVNLDIGGLEGAENNIASYDDKENIISIRDKQSSLCGFIRGINNTHYYFGAWETTHQNMKENKLQKVGELKWQIRNLENGIVFSSNEGQYAILFPKHHKVGSRIERERAIVWTECNPTNEREVWLAFSWFFPFYVSRNGEELGHFYANYFDSAEEVAHYSLKKGEDFLKEIEKWQGEIYALSIPLWLKDALINGLYPLVKNSLYTKDGRFSLSESFTGCPINETLVCRFNGSFPLLIFFPELEKKTIREFANLQKEDGEIPFCFGMQDNFSSPVYHLQHPIVSTEFVLMVWRDYYWTKDSQFLKELYPFVKKAIHFARTLDRNGDYLIEEDPQPGQLANQYYDVWEWHGVSSYVNSILLASLKAVTQMAGIMEDEDTKKFASEWFEKAQEEFQRKLWNGRWFNLYSNDETSETSLTNQLVGQWYAYLSGLGEILPKEKIISTIHWIGELNAKASPYGAVNGVTPEGKPDETGRNHQSDGISPGENFAFSSLAISAGERELGLSVSEKVYINIALLRKSPWNIYFNYLSSTGEEWWGSDYYSNMSIWSILIALIKGGAFL